MRTPNEGLLTCGTSISSDILAAMTILGRSVRVETLVVMFRLRFLLVARESAGGAPLRLLQFSGVPPSVGTTTTSALLVSVVVVVLFGKL